MKRLQFLFSAVMVSLTLAAQVPTRTEVILYSSDPAIWRVVRQPKDAPDGNLPQSVSVVLEPETTSAAKASFAVQTDKGTDRLRFVRKGGKTLLAEGENRLETITEGPETGSYRVSQTFLLDADEPIYGVGMLQNGKMSQRGEHRMMVQSNTEDFAEVYVSPKGYAIFWDNSSPTMLDSRENLTLESQVGDAEDYYVICGDNLDEVMAGLRKLTGHVPMLPLWTYGYHQSRERYKTQREILGIVEGYRQRGVPLDGIIQDWQYWGNNYQWNAMEFLNEDFPNPKEMMDNIHRMNAHISISIWQSFGPMTKPYRALAPKGLMLGFETWPYSGLPFWPPRKDYPSGVRCYDVYSAEARDIFWENLRRLYDLDIDAWWMDSTDPDCEMKDSELDMPTSVGSWRRVRNTFPLLSVAGVYDHQRATQKAEPNAVGADKRVFIFTRSYFAGQQRYGAGTWSGDVNSSWDVLRRQIPLCLNATLTGNPHVNTDIGGFFPGPYNRPGQSATCAQNPLFQELYVRWLQFGLFCPMMRSHGESSRREIWEFGKPGEPVYDAIEKNIRLRYTLLPYIYSLSWQVTSADDSFMRPLVMDYGKDRRTWDLGSEFLFGRNLLVAPVAKALYTNEERHWSTDVPDWNAVPTVEAYLPAGNGWWDWWTCKHYKGGQTVTVDAPLDHSPLFVRDGSIIPLGPDVQYASEKKWDDIEVVVWPGADASFTLYEDEGDSYRYEEGAYSTITMTWNNNSRTFTIGTREGTFPGMLETRTFRVRRPDGTATVISYNGSSVSTRL